MQIHPPSAKPQGSKHWHYIYKKRRQTLGIKPSQLASAQVIALLGSIIAGLHLEAHKETLLLVAGAFVILPAVFDLSGSLGAALSAKINHQLGRRGAKTIRIMASSIGYALLIAALAGWLVSVVGASIAAWIFGADFRNVFVLSQSAIMLSAAIGFPLVGLLTLLFRKLKVNPDDVVSPLESSVFDMLTVITLAVVIGWIV